MLERRRDAGPAVALDRGDRRPRDAAASPGNARVRITGPVPRSTTGARLTLMPACAQAPRGVARRASGRLRRRHRRLRGGGRRPRQVADRRRPPGRSRSAPARFAARCRRRVSAPRAGRRRHVVAEQDHAGRAAAAQVAGHVAGRRGPGEAQDDRLAGELRERELRRRAAPPGSASAAVGAFLARRSPGSHGRACDQREAAAPARAARRRRAYGSRDSGMAAPDVCCTMPAPWPTSASPSTPIPAAPGPTAPSRSGAG